MKKATIRLLIEFIQELINMLVYQSNIYPHEHLRDLLTSGKKLIDVLEKE